VLTTNPDCKGCTWQNAVYFVEELRVFPDDHVCIEASHDTYSIAVTVRVITLLQCAQHSRNCDRRGPLREPELHKPECLCMTSTGSKPMTT
jgi:hypothetical protein